MSETVLQDFERGVLTLTLNRPAKKNAFNREQWGALRDAILQAGEDDRVRVVLLTGAGGNFSSGADLNDMSNIVDHGAGDPHPFQTCVRAVAFFEKPLVAAAPGVAVGGGATLLLHCDVVCVGESLRMRFPFVNLGLVPELGSSYTLQALIGPARAAELMYTARWVDAATAVATGIAAGRFADDAVLAAARERALEMAQWPLNSLRETKRTLKAHQFEAIERALKVENEGMARQAGSAENQEAIRAFLEKRPPKWS
jgi:enoyl-CoA hydratase/carnithine racemase